VPVIVRIINIHIFLTMMCDAEDYWMSVICHFLIFRATKPATEVSSY